MGYVGFSGRDYRDLIVERTGRWLLPKGRLWMYRCMFRGCVQRDVRWGRWL